MNQLPATDTGADLDALQELFQKAGPGVTALLISEAVLRFEELPTAVLIAVLVLTKGNAGVQVLRAPLYNLTELTLERRGCKASASLLAGLR